MRYSERIDLTRWIEISIIAVLAFLVRAAYLEQEPIHDELQHLLAARSWVANGSFAIADGSYDRAGLYTILVGLIYSIFGDSVTTVRMSSVAIGTLWVVAVFAWCQLRIGRTAAWIAAILMCLAPGAIFLSQFIRFYALHGLMFWLAAISVYELIEQSHSPLKRALLAAAAVLSLGIAAHLQQTTLIGALGLFAFVVLRRGLEVWTRARNDRRVRNWLWTAVAGCCAAGAIALLTGIVADLFAIYTWAPMWARGGGPLRYHWMLVGQYPVIWATIPLAMLYSFAKKSAPGILCTAVFGIAIPLHSFAGIRAERIIYYVMPFFFILGAILAAELVPYLRQLASSISGPWPRALRPAREPFQIAALTVVAFLLLLSNPALRATADMVRGLEVTTGNASTDYWSRYESNWEAAREVLQPLIDTSDIVIASHGLHMLYFADRFDLEVSTTRLSDLYRGSWDESREFLLDSRTGRRVFSTAASFERVRSCYPTGLVVIRSLAWRNPAFVSPATADAIEANAVEISVPEDFGLHVFRWTSPAGSAGERCEDLPR